MRKKSMITAPVRTIVLIIGAIVLLLVLLNGFGIVGDPVIVYPRR